MRGLYILPSGKNKVQVNFYCDITSPQLESRMLLHISCGAGMRRQTAGK